MWEWIRARLIVLAGVYVTALCAWAVAYLLCGDRWWELFVLNTFAIYLFAPLPALLLLALWARHRVTWLAFVVMLGLGGYFFGELYLPKLPRAFAHNRSLTVMSYNLLGFNQDTGAVLAAIRASGADVVALQELNPAAAAAIAAELAQEYPYQVLDPRPVVEGMGVISRLPLRPTGEALPGHWVGTPQVLALDFDGTTATVLHFHAQSGPFVSPEREEQARIMRAYSAAQPGPLLALGDLNATGLSTAYRLLTTDLHDAWREAGWGAGHTFPGADPATSPGSSRTVIAGVPVPMWLVRIDYVLHSPHWVATSARIGPWDGVSDHRPVIAELVLAH